MVRIAGVLYRLEPVGPGLARAPAMPSYADVVRQYLAATHAADRPSTRESKRSIFESCLLPMLGPVPIDRVDRAAVLDLQAQLLASGLAPRTVNLYMAKAQAVLRWAAEELGCVEPVRRVRRLRVSPASPGLRREHYEALLRALPEGWVRTLLLLCGDAGLRIGEAVALEWRCVGATSLCVCASTWRAQRGSTKSGRARVVPLTARLRSVLESVPRTARRVVDHARIETRHVVHRTDPICARLGIPRVTPHLLRHSFASELQRRGVGTATIRDLLGHGSVAITDAYLHTEPEGLAAAVALLDGEG